MKYLLSFLGILLLWAGVVFVPPRFVEPEPHVLVSHFETWDDVHSYLDKNVSRRRSVGPAVEESVGSTGHTVSLMSHAHLVRFHLTDRRVVDVTLISDNVWHGGMGFINYAQGAERMVLQGWDRRPILSLEPSLRLALTDSGLLRFHDNGFDVTMWDAEGREMFHHQGSSPITAFTTTQVAGDASVTAIGYLDGTIAVHRSSNQMRLENNSGRATDNLVYGMGVASTSRLLVVRGRAPARLQWYDVASGTLIADSPAKPVDGLRPDGPVRVLPLDGSNWLISSSDSVVWATDGSDQVGGDDWYRQWSDVDLGGLSGIVQNRASELVVVGKANSGVVISWLDWMSPIVGPQVALSGVDRVKVTTDGLVCVGDNGFMLLDFARS